MAAQPVLPVRSASSLRNLAIQIAEMQDHDHVGFRQALESAKVYYKAMRSQCRKFQPWIDPRDKQYVHTLCKSGTTGRLLCGEACYRCEALTPDVLPNIVNRPGGFRLVQIGG